MKKVAKKTTIKIEDNSKRFDKIEVLVEKLAVMTANGFSSLEQRLSARIDTIENELKTKASKADILELHDKFIHRREFDQLSLRVSKLEEKTRK
jgi:hypothetical protein